MSKDAPDPPVRILEALERAQRALEEPTGDGLRLAEEVTPTNPKRTVLVVEDDPMQAFLLLEILEAHGFRVLSAGEPRLALELSEDPQVELVIMDIVLPGMSGLDLLAELRQNPLTEHLPVILLSALSETEDRVRGLRQGADDYLAKPFEPDELVARVDSVLDRRHAMSGVVGRLESRSLATLLRTVSRDARSGLVEVRYQDEIGRLVVRRGLLHRARFRRLSTEEALLQLVELDAGVVRFYPSQISDEDEESGILSLSDFLEEGSSQDDEDEEQRLLITQHEERGALLERFAHLAEHDLKNPLVTIRTYLGLLARDASDPERFKAHLERIQTAAGTMQDLLQELARMARQARRLSGARPIALREVVGEALVYFSDEVEELGVEIKLVPGMPRVLGSRSRLIRIYTALLDNALRFLGSAKVPRIEIGAERRGATEVVCWVRDNGAGIEPRFHERVFGLGEKLDATGGGGMGLAVARRLVEQHGGRIWVESKGRDQGSTFLFTLPLDPPGDPPDSSRSNA